jgi:hypothetical protein
VGAKILGGRTLEGKIFLKSRGTIVLFNFLDENTKKKPFLNASTKRDIFQNIGRGQKHLGKQMRLLSQLKALHIQYTRIHIFGPFITSKLLVYIVVYKEEKRYGCFV